MGALSQQGRWAIVSSGAAMAAAGATRMVLKRGWKSATGRKPPQNPATPHVSWLEAVGWALTAGAAVSLTRLLAERGAAAGWRKVTGRYPATVKRRRGK
jgi:hypothetical protein